MHEIGLTELQQSPVCLFCRFLNGQELQESDKVHMEFKDGTYTLQIKDATSDFAGVVEAVAVNSGGEVLCAAKLDVRGRSPEFLETPLKCTVLEGMLLNPVQERKGNATFLVLFIVYFTHVTLIFQEALPSFLYYFLSILLT